MLNRLHAVQHPEQKRIAWNTLEAKISLSHARRQTAGTDNFHPILENIDLHIGRGTIIAMGKRVHHRLAQRLFGQFRSLITLDMLDDVLHIDL